MSNNNLLIIEHSLTDLQMHYNNLKDDVIDMINCNHGLSINPAEYLVVPHVNGILGRAWNALLGRSKENAVRFILIRVNLSTDSLKKANQPEQKA